MEKRAYELAEMLREAEGRTAYRKMTSSNTMIPSCINTEYCLPTPTDMNCGILTMAFVDMQPLDSVYPANTAFKNGPLFPNIDKPFYGGMKR